MDLRPVEAGFLSEGGPPDGVTAGNRNLAYPESFSLRRFLPNFNVGGVRACAHITNIPEVVMDLHKCLSLAGYACTSTRRVEFIPNSRTIRLWPDRQVNVL